MLSQKVRVLHPFIHSSSSLDHGIARIVGHIICINAAASISKHHVLQEETKASSHQSSSCPVLLVVLFQLFRQQHHSGSLSQKKHLHNPPQ